MRTNNKKPLPPKKAKKGLYQCFETMACENTEMEKMAKLRSCLSRK